MIDSVERVLAAAVEGQAQDLRYIEQQLSKLHAALVKASPELRAAIQRDTKNRTSEVELQLTLALENLAATFAKSNFETALHKEYSLARGENAADNLAPYGTAYIVPSRYNLVYSCITSVSAAISAGNCVILELPRTLSTVSQVLEKTLLKALDHQTFTIVDKRLDSAILSKQCIQLYGSPSSDVATSENVLVVPSSKSVAIVDRYADMKQAASSILRARFAFGGQAPIAPDHVLVNEFRVKEFCQAIAEKTSTYFAQSVEMNGGSGHGATAKARASRTLSLDLDQAGAEILISGSNGTVVRVSDRKSSILKKKINEPLLVIHPVSSLDDAIDFINSSSDEPLACVSSFGSLEVGKYVSQFTKAHVCCVNEIPVELLVAPLTPVGFATQLNGPYRREMFSRPQPQYAHFGDRSTQLAKIIDTNDVKEAVKLRNEAQKTDTKVKRPPGHAIGFFEQGLLVGASVASTVIGLGTVAMVKYGIPAARRRLGS